MKAPKFQLQKVYEDGNREEPKLFELKDVNAGWRMGRRGFLLTTAVGVGALGACAPNAPQTSPTTGTKEESQYCAWSHLEDVISVCFSGDGRILASGSGDWTIKLWEMPSGNLLNTMMGHESTVLSVCFSPDGRLLASGSWDYSIKLWEVPSGKLLNTLKEHFNSVSSVRFSPDGRLLASGSWDGTVKLWEMPAGKLLNTLTGHADSVIRVCFSPDGRLLASGSSDKTIKLDRKSVV